MPQLVKGGKHAFGWSVVGIGGEIVLPPEAIMEYGFEESERLLLIRGSETSGGFGLGRMTVVADSPIGAVLEARPELVRHEVGQGEIVEHRGKPYCWVEFRRGSVVVPPATLARYRTDIGDRLLVIRGSGRALGFAVRGPIVDEATRHPELDVFGGHLEWGRASVERLWLEDVPANEHHGRGRSRVSSHGDRGFSSPGELG